MKPQFHMVCNIHWQMMTLKMRGPGRKPEVCHDLAP